MNLINIFKRKKKIIKDRFILSIDGGGMRGIIPTVILKDFYSMLCEKETETYPLTKYFDVISGTSTGGLIATALTCGTEMNKTPTDHGKQTALDSLIDIYKNDGKIIFPQEISSLLNPMTDKYPVAPIEKLLKTWFGDTLLSEAIIPTLIMGYNVTLGQPFVMSDGDDKGLQAWQVARCTSAAPTYFAPFKHKSGLIIDGGLIANNPSLYAYRYAKQLYPDSENFHILSLSTCPIPYQLKTKNSWGIASWLNVHELYLSSQIQAVDDIALSLKGVNYLRIDKPLDKKIPIDKTKLNNLIQLEKHAKLLYEDNIDLLSTFADELIKNRKTKGV